MLVKVTALVCPHNPSTGKHSNTYCPTLQTTNIKFALCDEVFFALPLCVECVLFLLSIAFG